MDAILKRLKEKMPPPKKVYDTNVDWGRLESGVGPYPGSFKEFVAVYGGCVWFDHVSPLYSMAKSDADVKKFRSRVEKTLKPLETNLDPPDLPLYPERGGLFPFMIDYSSCIYLWKTRGKNPDAWPIVCWVRGSIVELGKMTLPQMLLDWLESKPRMVKLWGNISELPPDRIRLNCSPRPED